MQPTGRVSTRRVAASGTARPAARLLGREVALVVHQPQHQVAALLGGLGVAHRVVRGRALRDPRDRRGLQVGEARRRLAEVPLRRRLDAVGVQAELRDVQVALEDLVLGHLLLERDGQALASRRLAGVPLGALRLTGRLRRGVVALADRLLDQHVLDVLLRQRRRALGALRVLQVADQRPQHALGVDAAVLVEPLVLDRDDGLAHGLGHRVQGDDLPVLRPERRQHRRAVRGQHRRPLGQRLALQARSAGPRTPRPRGPSSRPRPPPSAAPARR